MTNLYTYIMARANNNPPKAAEMAEEAYARFRAAANSAKGVLQQAEIGRFEFAFMHGKGYESFAWRPNDVVNLPANGGSAGQPVLGIVSGYHFQATGRWTVVVQTAASKDVWCDADKLREASFPPGLVEIIRRKFDKGEVD